MKQKVVVFGSYVQEFATRQPGLPVPGQTILGSAFWLGYGGKGSNQAVAAKRAGADVTLVTKVGDDQFGRSCLDFYRAEGMETKYVLVDSEVETGSALIMVDENSAQNQIVVVPGASKHFVPADIEQITQELQNCDYVLLQHEVNDDMQERVVEIAYAAGAKVILNPAPAHEVAATLLEKLYAITPNETEAQALTGITVVDEKTAAQAAQKFLDAGVQNVVITMGSMGAFATDGVRKELVPRLQVNAVDTTGAGDAFNGGFVTALSEGKDLFDALRFGNATGALSVTKPGAAPAMPYRTEIDSLYQENYGK